jgi:hypothetical protein
MQAVNACIAAMRMSHCQPVNICRHCSMPVTRTDGRSIPRHFSAVSRSRSSPKCN